MAEGPALHTPDRRARLGLFLVSAGVILWEILLTRIYSVTLYYHFAFLAVSIALFGFTLGAVLVFVRPREADHDALRRRLAMTATVAGLLMPIALLVQLALPFRFTDGAPPSWYLLTTYLLSTLPFVPAGACVTLALTRYERAGTLYAWDLAGAALGCAVIGPVLAVLGGPGAAAVAGAVTCLGAAAFVRDRRRSAAILILGVGLLGFGALNVEGQWLRIRYGHQGKLPPAEYERWNAFSRIIVRGGASTPFGWGIHPDVRERLPLIEQKWLEIDSGAGTPITAFDGDFAAVGHLKHDITGLAHRLRTNGRALVMGVGGGRDVLSALAHGQKHVTGVEVNPAIVEALTVRYGEFSGHIDRRPDVSIYNDEARSWMERHTETFDVVQASFVDTAAATAAGAYAFTENGLYTVEGWRLFLSRLNPRGILTFSRWYFGSAKWPVEIYRTLALAGAALRASGVEDVERHVIVARVLGRADVIATILVSRDPFTDADLEAARVACQALKATVVFSSRTQLGEHGQEMAKALTLDHDALVERYPLDVTPPYDDHPFFFFHTRIRNLVGLRTEGEAFGGSAFNTPAVRLLGMLLVISLVLGAVLIVLPMGWLIRRGEWRVGQTPGRGRLPLYFACIGLGFMFVEIALIQRLSLFLGHPTYGFTVVLLGLLLSAGIGSLVSEKLVDRWGLERTGHALLLLVGVLLVSDALGVLALSEAIGASTPARLLIALGLIGPPALLMGMGFPLGMARVAGNDDPRGPWLWGVNGACSVIASIVAMICSLELGIRATFCVGAAIYLLAALLFRWTRPSVEADPAAAT